MTTRIVFLVLPHVHLMDLAGPDQVFLEAIGYGAELTIEYCTTSDALATSGRLPLGHLPHYSRVRFAKGDYLIVPGAELAYLETREFERQLELFRWLREARTQGAILCSVCSGSFVLARAGLLDGKQCTTHWKRTTELGKQYPRARVVENVLFTEDAGIFTSAGIASGIDLALHLVERMYGDAFAHKVARELVIYKRRAGGDAQESVFLSYRNHIHAGIHRVQDWLQEHLDKKTTLGDLAELANMSERTLTRIFRKETGLTVKQYQTLLRRERIRELVKSPDLSRRQIATLCGLESERQVSRLLHA